MNIQEQINALVQVALGKEPADLVITSGNLVNVYSAEVLEGHSISIKGDKIAFVGPDASHTIGKETKVIDAQGKFLLPGFIDAHFHFTDVAPDEFIGYSAPTGTTTIFAELDLGTVVGYEGTTALLDNMKGQPIKFFGLAPSIPQPPQFLPRERVPISCEEVESLLQREDVVGLGETLWIGVLEGDKDLITNIRATLNRKKKLEGHASGAKGYKLAAYVASGISSCHESINAQEAMDKLRLGMCVMIREGSIRRDLEAISSLKGKDIDFRRLALVTDGIGAEDLAHFGHMNYIVQKAIDLGIPATKAIQMATLNPAEHFGLDNLIGGIAPGKCADILILPSLAKIECELVISNGRIIAKDGELLIKPRKCIFPDSVMESLHVPRKFSPADFDVPARDRKDKVKVRIMKLITEVITQEYQVELHIRGNRIKMDVERDILKVSVIDRKDNTGEVVTGFVQGFGLKSGAFASSYSWELGSPIVAVGADEEDMAMGVNRVIELQGGLVVTKNGEVIAELPLPVGGCMAGESLSKVIEGYQAVKEAVKNLGSSLMDPYLTLQTLPGTFLPYFRITLQGFADMKNKKVVALIVD